MGPLRTYIADDHVLFRAGIKQLLESMSGFSVIADFADGQALLEQVQQVPCDLVVLDHDMPRCSGLDVVANLRKDKLPVKVIVMTGLADPQLLVDYAEYSPEGMVLKSDDASSLRDCFDAVGRGDRYVSTEIQQLTEQAKAGSKLTSRERQVLRHIAKGLSNKEVARVMGIAPKTVDSHRTNVMQKLDLHNAAELVNYALKTGLA